MTSSFEAKVNDIPCQIWLDDEYHISKITTNEGKWLVTLDDENIKILEDHYDYLIAAVKKEDEQDNRESDEHVRIESNNKRFV